jgi:hypothetical protein
MDSSKHIEYLKRQSLHCINHFKYEIQSIMRDVMSIDKVFDIGSPEFDKYKTIMSKLAELGQLSSIATKQLEDSTPFVRSPKIISNEKPPYCDQCNNSRQMYCCEDIYITCCHCCCGDCDKVYTQCSCDDTPYDHFNYITIIKSVNENN